MLFCCVVIAVSAGIVTSELIAVKSISLQRQLDKSCKTCKARHLDNDANYCKYCGEML